MLRGACVAGLSHARAVNLTQDERAAERVPLFPALALRLQKGAPMSPLQGPSIQRVLVLTDFSATSDRAADWAIALARSHDAEVRVVHGLQRPSSSRPGSFSIVDRQTSPLHAAQQLAGMEANLPADVRVRTEVREFSSRDMVSELSDDELPDVIAIGANGHGPVRRFFLGSTAVSVVQAAPRPVVTVHADDIGHPRGVRSILIPTDLTDQATQAAHAATSVLPRDADETRLVLLHVYRLPVPIAAAAGGAVAVAPAPPALPAFETQARARAELHHIADGLRARGHTVEALLVDDEPGSIASVTVRVAQERGVDLIALSTHNRTGVERLLAGSVAEKVLSSAGCPVLTFPVGTSVRSTK